ncbi:MAG: N-acetylneuraminate synthase [Desulfobacteraceae bacterium]|nr:N-acetylneuraminate synthase [Desulfobacteraceae bacterium]
MENEVRIIAEAGVNHNGSLERARQLVKTASDTGADLIKFQTFKAEEIITRRAPKAKYQVEATSRKETQYEMLKRLELDADAHQVLKDDCRNLGIGFLSTPFDMESFELLVGLGLEIWKIPSGEITNLPYLRKIGALNHEVILSTGMADLGEIEDALQVLEKAGTPRNQITVLHCSTAYPTPMNEVNLRAMQTIATAFKGVRVGYSDHTLGIEIPVAAVALGASTVEKHFTLDRSLPGPDHAASLEPDELAEMITAIRNIERAFGSGEKKPCPSEAGNRDIVRKSIVAACAIREGEPFTEQNMSVKRPGGGIDPMRWDELLGRKSPRDFNADEMIEL